jgi:hypothetical protein
MPEQGQQGSGAGRLCRLFVRRALPETGRLKVAEKATVLIGFFIVKTVACISFATGT